MIHCGLKTKQKTGLEKCYPYDLLQLSYMRGKPDCLDITVSDMTSINRPCCVIPKIECANDNFSADNAKRKKMLFWLLTLQNVDRNSWKKISSGINSLNNTGEFIIPSEIIASSERQRDRSTNSFHEDVSDNETLNSDESD